MTSVLENNLACLETHRPELYRLVTSIEPDRAAYRRSVAANAMPIIEIVSGTGRTIPLHSRHDPQREAERAVEVLGRASITVPVLLGMGAGYELSTAWSRYRDRFFDLLVVERDPQIFLAALESLPLSGVLQDERVLFVVGEDFVGLRKALRRLLPGIMTSGLQLLESRGSAQVHEEYYKKAAAQIDAILRHTSAEFSYMARYGPQLQYNVWMNLPAMLGQPGLRSVSDLWKGRPGVLVGAGPSLTRNVNRLAQVRDKVLIVCVDTAYRILESRGIEPHIVVAADPTELEVEHFQNLRLDGNPLLAFDPEVYPTVPNGVPWRKLILNLEKSQTTRWFEQTCGTWGLYDKGGSVAHTAWMVLEELGADPVILIGMDLAFPPGGGQTHAEGAALSRAVDAVPENAPETTLGPHAATQDAQQETLVWVPGIMGGKVPTSEVMALYLNTFQEKFAETRRRVIDATEGGAFKAGTAVETLERALQAQVSMAGPTPEQALRSLNPSRPPDGYSLIADEIHRFADGLSSHASDADKALSNSQSLDSELRRGSSIYEHPDWLAMEKAFQALYRDSTLKISLDQALFSATYYFSQKEDPKQTNVRLDKYRTFFRTLAEIARNFEPVLRQTADTVRSIPGS